MNITDLKRKVKKLERKLCCITVYKTTASEFPTTGRSGTLYVDKENSEIYTWDGTDYVSTKGSGLEDIIEGTGISIDKTDPLNPIISSVSSSDGTQVNNYREVNANDTVLATDYTVDNFTSGVTTTLLSAVGITGQIFNIANSSGGDITIGTAGSETIYLPGGVVTTLTLLDGENLTVQSTGTNYRSL